MPVTLTFIVLASLIGIWAPLDRWGKAGITGVIGVLWILVLTGTLPC